MLTTWFTDDAELNFEAFCDLIGDCSAHAPGSGLASFQRAMRSIVSGLVLEML